MNSRRRYIILLCFAAYIHLLQVQAAVTLPKVIGSNMVLQRNKPVCIWGTAAPAEKISVRFNHQLKNTTAGADGKWMVMLDKMPASGKPAEMVISGTNTITLNNILVGEVWLCSGQSNMEYTMTKSSKYALAKNGRGLTAADLQTEQNDHIRLFLVKRDLTKPGDANKGWEQAAGTAVGTFSAVGYHFAKNLQERLQVPVGMIAASVSGSSIEPWMDGTVQRDSRQALTVNQLLPGKFFAGMISPLAPFTLKGFLWYQGETNCFLKETSEYTFKFRHLITSWRKRWRDADAPFYFVQIAPFNYSKSKGTHELNVTSLAEFREAQQQVLDVHNTGMVITTDLVDDLEDIHPTYKWEIGRRLALVALSGEYEFKEMASSGPVFKSMQVKGDKIEITFRHAANGLISKDGLQLNWFEIAGADGRYIPAEAFIHGNRVMVSAALVKRPVNVRFGWNEAAQPNLFNSEGLPAVPFRTDREVHSTASKN